MAPTQTQKPTQRLRRANYNTATSLRTTNPSVAPVIIVIVIPIGIFLIGHDGRKTLLRRVSANYATGRRNGTYRISQDIMDPIHGLRQPTNKASQHHHRFRHRGRRADSPMARGFAEVALDAHSPRTLHDAQGVQILRRGQNPTRRLGGGDAIRQGDQPIQATLEALGEKLATKLKIGLATETHLATAPLAKAHAPSALPSIPMLHALEAGNRGQLLAAAKTYVARKHHNGRRGAPGKNDIVVHRDGVAKGSRKVSEVQVKLDRGSELTLRRERRGSCERSSQGQRHKKKTME